MDSKQNQAEPPMGLLSWVQEVCRLTPTAFYPLPADAGARRYFHLTSPKQDYVVMDASNIKDSCPPYIAISQALRQLGLHTPEVLAADLDQGYLLLTHFGDLTYLKALSLANADQLYDQALAGLAVLQTCRDVPKWSLPHFDANWMWQEWIWHKEWFLNQFLGLLLESEKISQLDLCYEKMITLLIAQPQVFMHRDYHSANLMVLKNNQVGILDFQDAFIGPITYDVVSLLRDCYIDWPLEKVHQWALQYLHYLQQSNHDYTNIDEKTFLHWFDWMGIERHLKALFTFARKYVRDHDARYLSHMPRTLDYLLQVSARYPELAPFHFYFQETVRPQLLQLLKVTA